MARYKQYSTVWEDDWVATFLTYSSGSETYLSAADAQNSMPAMPVIYDAAFLASRSHVFELVPGHRAPETTVTANQSRHDLSDQTYFFFD
jgi:hypothetical protein